MAQSQVSQVPQIPQSPSTRPFKIARYKDPLTLALAEPEVQLALSLALEASLTPLTSLAPAIAEEAQEIDPMKQDIDQLIEKLRFWATDQNVTPDVQQARANVCEQLSTQWMDWLHVPETRGYLTLRGNLLPDLLFYEAFLQEKLIKLKIICHEEEATESGILRITGN